MRSFSKQSAIRSTNVMPAEFKEWIADDLDPRVVDAKWLAEQVAALGKKWSRKPASKARTLGLTAVLTG